MVIIAVATISKDTRGRRSASFRWVGVHLLGLSLRSMRGKYTMDQLLRDIRDTLAAVAVKSLRHGQCNLPWS